MSTGTTPDWLSHLSWLHYRPGTSSRSGTSLSWQPSPAHPLNSSCPATPRAGARAESKRRDDAAWRAAVEARLPAVARMLAAELGATRVLLFGSLTRGTAGPGSDVDLLVDGLLMERLIEATVHIDRLLIEASSDLVPAEKVRPEVLIRAIAEGRLLHGE